MKRHIKIRFNLAKGPNYMKWRIENTTTKYVRYYAPNEVQLVIHDAKLRNQPATAKKIHAGADKEICAWIECTKLTVVPLLSLNFSQLTNAMLSYNPRKVPYWTNGKENLDNKVYKRLVTLDKAIYTPY
jgi:hypothetical protein